MFLASPITFPNLGITVDPNPVAFTVFGKDIYWYGIILAAGLMGGLLFAFRLRHSASKCRSLLLSSPAIWAIS